MIRLPLLALALLATPVLAEKCPDGVGKRHGVCQMPPPPELVMTRYPASQNGAVRIKKTTANVVVPRQWIDGAYRAVETDEGVATPGILIDGLKATNIQRDGIQLRFAPGAIIRNFDLTHRAAPSAGTDLPEGIAIYENSTDVLIEDGRVSGFTWTGPGYQNGDGIATEGGSSGTIRRVVSSGNRDGAFDIKGMWTLDALTGIGADRTYRMWHQVTAGAITSIDGLEAVWFGLGAQVTIDKLVASSTVPATVLVTEGHAVVTIKACDLTGMAPGSKFLQINGGGNVFTFGPGCAL